MKKYLYSAIILLIACGTCWGIYQTSTIGNRSGVAGGGATTECVGFSTDCSESGAPAANYLRAASSADAIDCYRVQVAHDGTATRIRYYFRDYYDATYETTLYNGTTLIGTGAITAAANSWVWSSSLVVEDGQSLDVVTTDTLRVCISACSIITNGFQVTYTATGTDYWDYDDASGCSPATASWSSDQNYKVGIQLESQY